MTVIRKAVVELVVIQIDFLLGVELGRYHLCRLDEGETRPPAVVVPMHVFAAAISKLDTQQLRHGCTIAYPRHGAAPWERACPVFCIRVRTAPIVTLLIRLLVQRFLIGLGPL